MFDFTSAPLCLGDEVRAFFSNLGDIVFMRGERWFESKAWSCDLFLDCVETGKVGREIGNASLSEL